ncbi:MAG: hypothetical protein GX491_16255 [Chloroflexi bacterium]|nr:hypothetical protein [Chloroflexota bacterium]
MDFDDNRPEWQIVLTTIGQNLVWMALSVGVILDIFFIRDAYLDIQSWIRVRNLAAYRARGGTGDDFATAFSLPAIDMMTVLLLCVIAVAAAVFIEYFFRRAKKKGELLKRIGIVAGVEVGIVLLSMLVQVIV